MKKHITQTELMKIGAKLYREQFKPSNSDLARHGVSAISNAQSKFIAGFMLYLVEKNYDFESSEVIKICQTIIAYN